MWLRRNIDRHREDQPLSDDAARVAYSGMYGWRLQEYRNVYMLGSFSIGPKSLHILRSGCLLPSRDYTVPAQQSHLKKQEERWRVFEELNCPEVRAQIIRTERFARRIKRTVACAAIAVTGAVVVLGCGSVETNESYDCSVEKTVLQGPSDSYACELSDVTHEG